MDEKKAVLNEAALEGQVTLARNRLDATIDELDARRRLIMEKAKLPIILVGGAALLVVGVLAAVTKRKGPADPSFAQKILASAITSAIGLAARVLAQRFVNQSRRALRGAASAP